jgi:hypothetical protein
MTVARELARYKLHLIGVQEVRWDKEGTVRAGHYTFLYGKGNENHQLGTEFFVHQRIVSQIIREQNYSLKSTNNNALVFTLCDSSVLRGPPLLVHVSVTCTPLSSRTEISHLEAATPLVRYHLCVVVGTF